MARNKVNGPASIAPIHSLLTRTLFILLLSFPLFINWRSRAPKEFQWKLVMHSKANGQCCDSQMCMYVRILKTFSTVKCECLSYRLTLISDQTFHVCVSRFSKSQTKTILFSCRFGAVFYCFITKVSYGLADSFVESFEWRCPSFSMCICIYSCVYKTTKTK